MTIQLAPRQDKARIEQGLDFAPKFDDAGLIPVVATDANTGRVLMFAFMNDQASAKTIETGQAHYYSRSRGKLWKKGEQSGHVQKVVQLLTDCDQDALWMRVDTGGAAACHVGYASCFYREIPLGSDGGQPLHYVETEKQFDPDKVYGK
jgi:phosphoribosyl-AMP cyclohydrolase